MTIHVSAPFVRRPVATTLLMLVVLVGGIVAYLRMPLAALPAIDLPTIQITADLPGASPEVMATGVTDMQSRSVQGNTGITLQFALERDIDAAAQDVQAAIAAAAATLPRNLPHPPTWEKANPADAQIMAIALSSDVLPIEKVNFYADSYIAQQLSRIEGVGLVYLYGERKQAIRIQLDVERLNALGLDLEQVRTALGSAADNLPKGTLDGDRRSVTIDTSGRLTRAEDFQDIVVAWRDGVPIRVRDIGRAVDGSENDRQGAWVGEHPAIVIGIQKQHGFNVVATVEEIRRRLPALEQALPGAIKVEVVNDRTQTIRASLADAKRTLLLTIVLVVLVVYVFLRGVWSTLIPAIAIPLSICGAFLVLQPGGFSIDNLSLLGITIAVGFVVDDAIVVVENIVRHLESGMPAREAALRGAGETAFTVVSMTLSLVAALIPLLFMGDVVGRMLREFSITVSVALLASAVVSLTVTPMLCSVFLRAPSTRATGRLRSATDRAWHGVERGYARALDAVLRHQRLTMAVAVAVLVATLAMFVVIPKGFFPEQDTGQLVGATEASPDISAPRMATRQMELVRIVQDDPDVANVYSWTYSAPLNVGRIIINLKPYGERSHSAVEIMQRLRERVADVPGIKMRLRTRQELQVGARSSVTQFQYTLQDPDLAELSTWSDRLVERLATLPELSDVNSDLDAQVEHVTVTIDRERAARLGVAPESIDGTLYDALGQRNIATVFSQIDQYRVILEIDPAQKTDVSILERLHVPAASGRSVPLSNVATVGRSAGYVAVNHQGQFPSATLSFNLAPGVSLGQAVAAVERGIRAAEPPATLHGEFQGSAKAFQSSNSNMPWLILAAVLTVYVVLGILYESFIHPLTILSTLPPACLGALVALKLSGQDFGVISVVGIILLVGIVKKNAIMLIDVALVERRQRDVTAAAAIVHACHLRLRPILMTTAAALLGALPLALSHGPASELRAPVGIALVGGLLVSQALTLFTTPVVYLYLERFAQFTGTLRRTQPASESG
jgi:multidrug efflux pump